MIQSSVTPCIYEVHSNEPLELFAVHEDVESALLGPRSLKVIDYQHLGVVIYTDFTRVICPNPYRDIGNSYLDQWGSAERPMKLSFRCVEGRGHRAIAVE